MKTQVYHLEVAFGCLSQRLKITDSDEKEVCFFVSKRSLETDSPEQAWWSYRPEGCSWLKNG